VPPIKITTHQEKALPIEVLRLSANFINCSIQRNYYITECLISILDNDLRGDCSPLNLKIYVKNFK